VPSTVAVPSLAKEKSARAFIASLPLTACANGCRSTIGSNDNGITTPIEFHRGPALTVMSLVILPSAIGPFSALISPQLPHRPGIGAGKGAGAG
jgi:hypothetical protein